MNLDHTEQLRRPLQDLMNSASRINDRKPQRYWYPLSAATYGVEEVLAAVDSLCSFRTTMWEKTAAFEHDFAARLGHREAIMVNSGSSADLLIAFALVNPAVGLLQAGDEILVPAVTWPTQVWSAMMAGLKVRFVDVDPLTLNMDLDNLESRITPRSRALSVVHLMGNPCQMDRIRQICLRHDLLLVEDCCEALGSAFDGQPVGSFGVAGAFSFFFSHHLTTMEGGMVTCSDPALSDVIRLLRAHGWARDVKHMALPKVTDIDPRYMFLNWGFNVRPTELQAGFGSIQLQRLPGFHIQRLENARQMQQLLAPASETLTLMRVPERGECSWFALPMVVSPNAPFTRDDLLMHLEGQGIETRPIVAGNLLRQPAIRLFPEIEVPETPGADAVHSRGFYVGLHPVPGNGKLERLAETILAFIERRSPAGFRLSS
jgi:CDP-6-deoxy-D-xylo-4-hexulose-3-dehydrase